MVVVLSVRDVCRFQESLADPPKPNAAARRAAKRFKRTYG